MNWIFKTGDYLKVDSQKQEATAILEQKIIFSGKPGEDVLLIDKIKGEWEFISIYSIKEIDIQNPDLAYKKILVSLNLVKQFDKGKKLEDYIYSLSRITNYDNPMKHFTRKYSRLYETEFDAIVEDKIFVNRSILGTVLNALHRDHQEAYIAYIASEAPELLTNSIDIDKALNLLNTYLNFAIIEQSEYLKESASMIKFIISDDEFSEIGFSTDIKDNELTESGLFADFKVKDSKNFQMLKPQVDIIEKYLTQFKGLLEQATIPKQLFRDDYKFNQLFRKSRLPITLKRK